ncbi:MAG: pseudouridine synthase [Bradyrhizobium sp.]
MPRDETKDNAYQRGRRGKHAGGKRRPGSSRGAQKKMVRGGFAGKRDEGRERDRDERGNRSRPYGGKNALHRDHGDEPRSVRRDDGASRKGNLRTREDRPRKGTDAREKDRGERKPWRTRDEQPREQRRGDNRPRFSRERDDLPKFESRRDRDADRSDLRDHPRSDRRPPSRFAEHPRGDRDEEPKRFAKRPAFGGRGAYRERKRDAQQGAASPNVRPAKVGERIAKVLARAGLASRRDAEQWVVQGRVAVNGRVINSPALDVTASDVIAVDGKPLPPRERTRLFLYHKPRGLMTTHSDPEGRPTVFDHLPDGLPRLISVGRLDFNTEGLLLLTNDGGLARVLELPETGWLRRYRVRAHGEVTQAQLDQLGEGVEVNGIKYGPIDATLERDQGSNVWLVFAIREGKNREVRNVLSHLGLEVNRLIRMSYGPFQLGELGEGEVAEVRTRVLREQLGDKVIMQAGVDFSTPAQRGDEREQGPPQEKKPFKPSGKGALIADRKGRRVLVQRTGTEAARGRSEEESRGYRPPRRPKRGYHGKRDLKPQDE